MSYVMADWLALHELSPQDCTRIVLHIEESIDTLVCVDNTEQLATQENLCELPVEEVWALSASAMQQHFAPGADTIRQVESDTTRVFNAKNTKKGRENFTIDQGFGKYPFVCVQYLGRPGDILTCAHEFSHAVQLVACKDTFMAPATRELCAFLGELVVLNHLKTECPNLYMPVLRSWRLQNNRYFGHQLIGLKEALLDLNTPYEYRWNYPVARMLSINANDRLTPDVLWASFEGKCTFSTLVGNLLDET